MLNILFLLFIIWFFELEFHLLKAVFIFPISILVLILLFIIWPFHCFYLKLRKSILKTFINNLFPFGVHSVKFRDFIFGDFLTSLTRPFNDFTLGICILTCNDCMEHNQRNGCVRNNIVGLIINLLLFFIRLFQCLNRYYNTKMAWPNLANALKYSCGIVFTYISWEYSSSNRNLVILVGIINTSYLLFWDTRIDWNLGYFKCK